VKVLALEPYYGGSHQAFLDGWRTHSRHEWTLLTLPPYFWKWRMHHAAVTFAAAACARWDAGERWDAVFCSDMLNLAGFLGLAPPGLRERPGVVYFHENQLTYPLPREEDRDHSFSFMNLTSALAATRVWFNSSFHRGEFLNALDAFLKRMPPPDLAGEAENLWNKSEVHPPGIVPFPPRGERKPGPLRILWAARWEWDKNPETFFHALERLDRERVDFRVSVLGQQFKRTPDIFGIMRGRLAHRIDHWGFVESNDAYRDILMNADVAVSTAHHEFFGIGMVEAAAAGAFPLMPDRLAYPEVFSRKETPEFFYSGEAEDLAKRLNALAAAVTSGDSLPVPETFLADGFTSAHAWPQRAPVLDDALGGLV